MSKRRSFARAFASSASSVFETPGEHLSIQEVEQRICNVEALPLHETMIPALKFVERDEKFVDSDDEADGDGEHCLFCNESLTQMSERDSADHLRSCIALLRRRDSAANKSKECIASASSELEEGEYSCIVCGVDLSRRGVWARCRHLKSCAKKFCISTKDLLQMLHSHVEDSHSDDDELEGDNQSERGDQDVGKDDASDQNEIGIENASPVPFFDSSVPREWPCQLCTFINLSDCKKCEMCLTPRAVPEVHASAVISNSSSAANAFALMMTAAKKRQIPAGYSMSENDTAPIHTASLSSGRKVGLKSFKSSGKGKWKNEGTPLGYHEPYGHPPAYKMISVPEMSCPIIVDGFQYANKSITDCYFLTHFHSDHYTGLQKNFDAGRIYCSPSTAALIRLKIKPGGNCVIPLKLEMEYNIAVGGMNVKVTFIDANHCPGAVCILFVFENGKRVLHTGKMILTRMISL